MRQRVMIGMALLCDPALILADEPTTALDVTVQAQILELFRQRREEAGTSFVLVTHDLGVLAGLADRAVVMYAGRVAEEGPVAALFADAAAPVHAGPPAGDARARRGAARGHPGHAAGAGAGAGRGARFTRGAPSPWRRAGSGRPRGGRWARATPCTATSRRWAGERAPLGARSPRSLPGAAGPARADDGRGAGGRRRLLRRGRGRDARARGGVGVRQVDDGAGGAAARAGRPRGACGSGGATSSPSRAVRSGRPGGTRR